MPGITQKSEAIAQQTADHLGYHDGAGNEQGGEETALMEKA